MEKIASSGLEITRTGIQYTRNAVLSTAEGVLRNENSTRAGGLVYFENSTSGEANKIALESFSFLLGRFGRVGADDLAVHLASEQRQEQRRRLARVDLNA